MEAETANIEHRTATTESKEIDATDMVTAQFKLQLRNSANVSVVVSELVSSFYNQFKLVVRAVTPFRIRRKRVVYSPKVLSFFSLQRPLHNLLLIQMVRLLRLLPTRDKNNS